MKKQLCKFQQTMFAPNFQMHISRCLNNGSKFLCQAISEEICNNCSLRQPLTREDSQVRGSTKILDIPEEPRHPKKEVEHILDTYCLKCKHYNKESKICQACGCMSPAPLDEGAKFKHIHCPLELW